MHETFENQFLIRSSETDVSGFCRPSVLLSLMQDVANDHSALQGSSRDVLMEKHGAFWMLVRIWLRLDRPIRQDETLTVRTWQRGPDKVMVYRDFDLFVGPELVGEAVTAWVVADFESRRMLRPNSIPEIVDSPPPETVKDRVLRPIRSPKERTEIYRRTVRYSDLDVNGHMNNTRYADLAMDAFTPEELAGRFLSELHLNYSMECRAGETILVCRAELEGGWYAEGCGPDGGKRFESILRFSPLDKAGDS